jgi:thiol-disulfide isomerase/thioredoxin
MLPFLFLTLRLNLTLENHELLTNISQVLPVFGVFHSHHCGHCKPVIAILEEIALKYEDNPGILMVSSDCIDNQEAWATQFKPPSHPTFFLILGGFLEEVRVEHTIDGSPRQSRT